MLFNLLSKLTNVNAQILRIFGMRALLQDDLLGRKASEDELNKLKSDYIKLSHSTAKKLLDFWCEHQAAPKA